MKTLYSIILILINTAVIYAQSPKVLFLGNSYTYVNDLPTMINDLALSMDTHYFKDQNTPGGHRLMNHATNTISIEKIFSEQWDYVVLQAQSQEPSWPISQIESDVFPYAKQLSDSIKKNNPCTEILFFSTWGRKNGDSGNCAGWPPVCTFEGMNDRLSVGYYTMAQENNASIAPVGHAWKVAIEDNLFNDIDLYSGDGSHPSVYGTYLTACVFYQSIFREPVENADFYSSIDEVEALYLQSVANSVFKSDFEYLLEDTITNIDYAFNTEAWFFPESNSIADFSYLINEEEVTLTNNSTNGEDYIWNFGDGSFSNSYNPIYSYTTSGFYDIKLITSNLCSSDSITKNIEIQLSTNIEINIDSKSINIWTDKTRLYFENIQDFNTIEIFTSNGTKIMSAQINNRKKFSFTFDKNQHTIIALLSKKDGERYSRKIVF